MASSKRAQHSLPSYRFPFSWAHLPMSDPQMEHSARFTAQPR